MREQVLRWLGQLRLDGRDGSVVDARQVDLKLGASSHVTLEDPLRTRGAVALREHVQVLLRLLPEEQHAQALAARQMLREAAEVELQLVGGRGRMLARHGRGVAAPALIDDLVQLLRVKLLLQLVLQLVLRDGAEPGAAAAIVAHRLSEREPPPHRRAHASSGAARAAER